ncbi:MAG TPA: molybdopterin-dependent oxidoreductase [Terriglobia bacterium]
MLRREFIALAAVGGGGLLLPSGSRPLADSILLSSDPLIAEFNLQSSFERYTPTPDFYVRNHFPIPQSGKDGGAAFLGIEGKVNQPVRLSAAELSRLKIKEIGAVLECSGNGTGPEALASNGLWEGWALADVIGLARPTSVAKYMHLIGQDGFSRSVEISQTGPDAMLATRLNHQPLTPEHGAPWRALFPGWYGMNSVKWLERIVLSDTPVPSKTDEYLAKVGTPSGRSEYHPLPNVQVKSVVTYPAIGVILHPGTVTVRGLAWSGTAKIAAVEVSTDNGATWRVAELDPGGRYEWTLWKITVKVPESGVLNIACKAIDDKGLEQPAQRDSNRLDGYANNTIERVRFLVE